MDDSGDDVMPPTLNNSVPSTYPSSCQCDELEANQTDNERQENSGLLGNHAFHSSNH